MEMKSLLITKFRQTEYFHIRKKKKFLLLYQKLSNILYFVNDKNE